ncbi:MAG: response regulator [Phycisphaeraceae bacterium]
MRLEPESSETDDICIGVYAPVGRDTELICRFLRRDGRCCTPCHSFEQILDHVARGVGPVILTVETLTDAVLDQLLTTLDDQPSWSDLPVVILGGEMRWTPQSERLATRRGATVMDRPVSVVALLTVVRAGIEARRRQHQVRDMMQDLRTMNRQLQQRADQLQRLTRELTAAEHRERQRISQVLHDHLQQILVGAKMRLNLLKRQQSPKFDDVEELIDESVQVSRSLTMDLSPPFLHDASPAEMLHWLARRKQQRYGLKVHVRIRADVPQLRHELKILLFEVTRELLFNVVKHAGVDQATVELDYDEADGLTLVVEDKGRGFVQTSPDEQPMQTDGAIGLFRYKERVSYLGGELSVHSVPGEGTRVVMHLPPPITEGDEAASHEGEQPSKAGETDLPGEQAEDASRHRKVRVLIADDHTMVRQGLRGLLESVRGLEVVGEAENGQQAVDRARELHPDIVIMDVSMPEMDGVEATRRITQEHTCHDIVGLSMHHDAAMAERMHQAGARTYLTKDEAMEHLAEVIRAFGETASHT